MDIPEPEERNCVKCLNSFSLNLFGLDSDTCRYCETGMKGPVSTTTKVKTDDREQNMIKTLDSYSSPAQKQDGDLGDEITTLNESANSDEGKVVSKKEEH